MAWTNSKIMMATLTDVLNNTTALDVNSDAWKVALYDNSITPSQTVASASAAYGGGVWAAGSGANLNDTSGWPYVGRPLANIASGFSSNVYTFDADDTVSANSSTTLVNAFGCLTYDDTLTTPVADQALCFNYFGGTQSVTAGTFTLVYNAAGIATITA